MIRNSGGSQNSKIRRWPSRDFPDNLLFFQMAFRRLAERQADSLMTIGFVGQRDIPGVMLRRAQAALRWDLRPSLWSHAFIVAERVEDRHLQDVQELATLPIREVTLHSRTGAFPEPGNNAIVDGVLGTYRDPGVDANVALVSIRLNAGELKAVSDRALWDSNKDRLRYNLWDTLGIWHSYLWSGGARPNPLGEGVPIFSSAFIEYCFEAANLDLSPGASERNSAPEHLWNAAVWWHEGLAKIGHPVRGYYVLRDPGCSVRNLPGDPENEDELKLTYDEPKEDEEESSPEER